MLQSCVTSPLPPRRRGAGAGLFHHTINIMHKPFLLLLTLLLSALAAQAQAPVNWATDVAPILYDHCVKCHRDGGLGHFSLIGYSNAVTNRFAIQEATASKRMPPWKPDPEYRRYAHENRLTDAEIATIKAWVDADAPPGDLAQAPPEPVFTAGSEVGIPDLMLQTPLYTVTATDDEYRCFVIPTGLSQAAYLRGLEALPGNHEVVHHILVYEDTTGEGRLKDLQTPEPGYVNFGSSGVQGARLVGAWVPGAQTTLVPPFMGVKLNPGSDLIVQMHYPKGSAGKTDQTTLNLFFTPSNQGIREIRLAPILNHTPLSLEDGPLNIPPDTKKTYHAKFRIPQAVSFVNAAPHMHLIGRNITCFAVTPQGDTIPIIRINDWDFHWQGGYFFQKVQHLPALSTLHAYAEYDNTADNPHQPSNPPQLVAQGESTTDEMMLVYFAFMAYQPGDENILLDSTLLSSGVRPTPLPTGFASLKIYPNPARDAAMLEYELTETTDLHTTIFDVHGHVVRVFSEKRDLAPGFYRETLPVADLPPGVYFARTQTDAGSAAIKFLVER